MVRKPDVQYIRCYTDGSSARALQLFTSAPKTKLPKAKRKKALVIRLDPLAYAGILVSLVMVVLMAISCIQLRAIQEKTYQMDSYVDTLKEQNARLSHNYHTGYAAGSFRSYRILLLLRIYRIQNMVGSVPYCL